MKAFIPLQALLLGLCLVHVTPVIQQRAIKQYHQDFPPPLKGGNKEGAAYLS